MFENAISFGLLSAEDAHDNVDDDDDAYSDDDVDDNDDDDDASVVHSPT